MTASTATLLTDATLFSRLQTAPGFYLHAGPKSTVLPPLGAEDYFDNCNDEYYEYCDCGHDIYDALLFSVCSIVTFLSFLLLALFTLQAPPPRHFK